MGSDGTGFCTGASHRPPVRSLRLVFSPLSESYLSLALHAGRVMMPRIR